MNVFIFHLLNFSHFKFLSFLLCNHGFSLNIIVYSSVKSAEGNNSASQLVNNLATMMSFYFSSLLNLPENQFASRFGLAAGG